MTYWYLKERFETGGHAPFYGYKELIYRGSKKPEKFLAKYQPDDEKTPRKWRVEWKNLKDYNPHYYSPSAEGMTEITEEEYKTIISENIDMKELKEKEVTEKAIEELESGKGIVSDNVDEFLKDTGISDGTTEKK
jgi:hypothetical protein